jgi:hypothetical protein
MEHIMWTEVTVYTEILIFMEIIDHMRYWRQTVAEMAASIVY